MEESRRTRNDQEKKKMFIKVGGVGGGGGIGAVVMLGSVLATAALASTFIIRKKGRSSGEEISRRHQDPPPEIKKQSEKEEANNGLQQSAFLDQTSDVYKQPSIEAKMEIESDNNLGSLDSSESLTVDEKPAIEAHDFEPKNELKKLENNAVSDVSVIKEEESFPLDENLSLEPKTTMQNEDEAKIKSAKEDIVSDENSKHSENLEQLHIEKEAGGERVTRDDGVNERAKMNYKEAVERNRRATIADNAVEGVHNDQKEEKEKETEGFSCNNGEISEEKHEEAIEKLDSENHIEDGQKSHQPVSDTHVMDQENVKEEEIVSESHSENGQKTALPVSDNPFMEQDNVKGNEIIPEKSENRQKVDLPVSDNPIMEDKHVKGNEIIPEKSHSENGQNDLLPVSDSPVIENNKPAEIVEIFEENEEAIEKTGQDEAKYVEEIWVKEEKEEKCDQTDEGIVFVPVKREEEANSSNFQHDENGQETGNSNPENGGVGVVMLEQDLTSLENAKNDETEDSSEITEEVGDLFDKFDNSIATAKDEMIMESSEEYEENTESLKDSNDESDSSDEVEKSSDSSVESSSEAVWPSETIIESQLSEMKGKTKEDVVSVKKPEKSNEKNYITLADTERTFIKHLVGMTMLREIATNLTRRRMIVGTGFALSTLSCSWFFGLTILKLCLIVFMTMALSKIHGY